MKEKILKILREAQQYISGQELCERLGVSRTAVWKVINQLKEEGYRIEAVNNRGYCILEYPDAVSESEIASLLDTRFLGKKVYSYKEVGSTNNTAKLLAEQGALDGTLVVTEIQSSGKGRRGRGWTSPAGEGIWMSFVLKPSIMPFHASMLTLVAGMAVVDGLEKAGVKASIKWPNDIVCSGKKVCGILTEMSAEMDFINYIVIGIGINVNTKEFPEEIAGVAVSLYQENPKTYHRAQIISDVLKAFEGYYESFLKTEDLTYLTERYGQYLININRQVRIVEKDSEFVGTARGINNKGELLVETDGAVRAVASGEVSVRGIYGYV